MVYPASTLGLCPDRAIRRPHQGARPEVDGIPSTDQEAEPEGWEISVQRRELHQPDRLIRPEQIRRDDLDDWPLWVTPVFLANQLDHLSQMV